jgi:hypothetical protein
MPVPISAVGTEMDPVTAVAERYRLVLFAKATGQLDPVYSDVDAARAAGHPDLPIPPTFLFGLGMGPDPAGWLTELGVDLRHVLHGEQRFTYHSSAHAGEVLTFQTKIVDTYTKKGGALDFIVRSTAVHRADLTAVADLGEVIIVRNPVPRT